MPCLLNRRSFWQPEQFEHTLRLLDAYRPVQSVREVTPLCAMGFLE
jgi:hypothetical protein